MTRSTRRRPAHAAATARNVPPQGPDRTSPRWFAVVPVLLVIALALLVVGLIGSAALWLALSLASSAMAAVLLVLERLVSRRAAGGGAHAAPTQH